MDVFKIFIVEDDECYAEALTYHLSMNPDYKVYRFSSGRECLDNLGLCPHLVSLDYSLPDLSGEEVLRKIKVRNPELPVVMVSAQEQIATAVGLLKEGAVDYLPKDEHTPERLWYLARNLKSEAAQQETNELLPGLSKTELRKEFSRRVIGESPAVKKLYNLMEKASSSDVTLSIFGELGTEKEAVARAIYESSPRRNGAFIKIGLNDVPKEGLESLLFGEEVQQEVVPGAFEKANGGVVFLDDFSQLEDGLQAKILRVLRDGKLRRVEGEALIEVDVRVMVGTHHDLRRDMESGSLREDLYFRLLGLPVEMPTLRERSTDIPMLAEYYLGQYCRKNGFPERLLTGMAKEKLRKYSFPGNVRELQSVVQRAAVISDSTQIGPEDISLNESLTIKELLMKEDTLKGYNARIIRHYLDKYDCNVLLVADKLNIGKSTIYRMLKNREI